VRAIKLLGLGVVVLGLVGCDAFQAAEKPRYSIKTVMKLANDKEYNLADRVMKGKASPEEQAKLLEWYSTLGANKPPRGDAESWRKKTTAITTSLQAVIDGKDGAEKDFNKAMNCKACHDAHR